MAETLDTSQVFPEGEEMYKYTTKNGAYVFYTDEPLTKKELAALDEHQEEIVERLKNRPGVKKIKV